MCAATQFAVDSIRDGARRRLLRMSLQNRSRTARHEVAYFLEDIRSKRVRVALGGFMEISRTSVVTMAVTATTYIVVMSQFAMQVQS
ncbi:hypothetical protein ONE63_003841 [Megalurothrips usitatus]|uniref:Gustatory receptor n=1 Tax=Megalurothrips usitatus TaxID=439358 RepID=A0AAV7XAU8_9NEOP|nr:hypothetical protein ONE63_003841 [Megalurothrips usitatus]